MSHTFYKSYVVIKKHIMVIVVEHPSAIFLSMRDNHMSSFKPNCKEDDILA
jgi:hypothetical protein